ncbi:hypothetical protein C0J08_01005 [Marinomonas sp. CT5]|nr:hypothetical protein C0J08_01005 [Marinomonas sp. CT5]
MAGISTIVQQQQDFPKQPPYIAEWSLCDQDTNGYVVIPFLLSSPSKVKYKKPFKIDIDLFEKIDTLSIQLISGKMGEAGARYQLSGVDISFHLDTWQYNIILHDAFGAIQVGYGPQSFLPQYLSKEQSEAISNEYQGSVQNYLEDTEDTMQGQGSYYYSLPLLEVEHFTIKKNNQPYMAGDSGHIWVDYVVQGFTTDSLKKLGKASWRFFAIQFPASLNQQLAGPAALMISMVQANPANQWENVNTASFYYNQNNTTTNGAIRPEVVWQMDSIVFSPTKFWTAPDGSKIPVEFEITLESGNSKSLIKAKANCDNQFIPYVDKYEGIFNVTANIQTDTFEFKNLQGFAWAEVH